MSTEKKSWFIREVSLGNLLIAVPLVCGMFVEYGKWASIQKTVEDHTRAIGDLSTNLASFTLRIDAQQADMRVQVGEIATKLDERTGKVK